MPDYLAVDIVAGSVTEIFKRNFWSANNTLCKGVLRVQEDKDRGVGGEGAADWEGHRHQHRGH